MNSAVSCKVNYNDWRARKNLPSSVLPYEKLPGLEHIFLEDSYILAFSIANDSITFTLDTILKDTHPLYDASEIAKRGDAFFFHKGALIFSGEVQMEAVLKQGRCAWDKQREADYGNIHMLYFDREETEDKPFHPAKPYYISSDIGDFRIKASSLSFKLVL